MVVGEYCNESGGGASLDHRLNFPARLVNELGVLFFCSRDVAIKYFG